MIPIAKKKTKRNGKTKKRNKRKHRSFMSAYFSLAAAVRSRIIQSQEPKSAGGKLMRKLKREETFPRFSQCMI